MALTTSEIESLRSHLRYGNVGVGAYPYTPDGFLVLFRDVIAPNLGVDTETTASTAVAVGIATVTPAVMTNIVVGATLVVDIGEDAEIVQVKAVAATTFTARFAKAHAATGYPVAVMSGKQRVRYLLAQADRAWAKLQASDITQTAGLKQLGQGEIEWTQGAKGVLDDIGMQYARIVSELASICRVQPRDHDGGNNVPLEMY